MTQKDGGDGKRVVFRRIGGRIVPIRVDVDVNVNKRSGGAGAQRRPSRDGNDAVTKASIGAAAAGAVVAGDAARTRRIYARGGVTIDRKKFSLQPFKMDKLGDTLVMRGKDGKRIGRASWYTNVDAVDGKYGAFSWLGVGKKHRGQGHAQTLSRVAAHEMKKSGAKSIFNQVVHPNSAQVNLTKNDSFWKVTKATNKNGDNILTKVNKTDALKNINWHRKTKGILTSDIFRKTELKGRTIMPGILKPHLTKSMKAKLIGGLAIAAAGVAAAFWNERD